MLIILEGSEGAGKSTIAQMVADYFDTKVMKRSSHIGWTKQSDKWSFAWDLNQSCLWDWRFLLEMINPMVDDNIVFVADRSFITQEVYHRTFWPEALISPMHELAYRDYARVLSDIKHLVVYIKRKIVREDDHTVMVEYNGDDSSFCKITKHFDSYFDRHKNELNIEIVNNDSTIEDAVKHIIDCIEKLQLSYAE